MEFTLPFSKEKAIIRDFMPHGVHSAVQRAMLKGVEIKQSSLNPTKEDLIREFGVEEIQKLDGLQPGKYEKRHKELKELFVARNTEMKGMGLENVEEANMILLEGMVKTIAEKPVTRDTLNELHQKDFEALVGHVNSIDDGSKSQGQQAN